MGALLAQDGTLEERSNQFHSNELGKVDLSNIDYEKIGNTAKSGGDFFDSIFGGSNEKGSGITKPNTLAHAIDKLDKANDYEATEIAPEAVRLKMEGASDLEVSNHILERLGYAVDGSLIKSNKWPYIKRTLDKAVTEAKSNPQSTGGQYEMATGNSIEQSYQNATKSGISNPLIYLLISAAAGTAGYYGYQKYKELK